MNTAVLDNYLGEFTFQKVSKIQQPYPVRSSQLQKLTTVLEQLAVLVEQQWEQLSERDRKVLIEIVYGTIESSAKNQNKILNLWRKLSFAWLLIKSGEESFVTYRNAVRRFIDSVLDRVERSHPDYEAQMFEVLQDVLAEPDNYPAMTQDEFGEWLSSL